MKEAVVMSVDMGRAMQLPYSEQMSRNSLAFNCIKLFLQKKMFNASKNLFGLGVFGDDEENGKCYFIHPLAVPKLNVIREINQLEELKVENKLAGGDIFESIKFSIDGLEEVKVTGKKTIKKRAFIFTSGEGKSDYKKDELKMLADHIQRSGAKVNVIAIDFMQGYDQQSNQIDGVISINPQQQKNSELLLKLKDFCPDNVRIIPASIAIELYKQFQKRQTNRVAIYRGPFQITPGLTIDVATYSHIRKDKMVSLKKYNMRSDENVSDKQGLIHTEALYQVEGHDKATIVDPEDVISGYKYGDGIVPITQLVKEQMKILDFKILQLIGFVDKSSIPRHYFMGNIYKVVPSNDVVSQKMFSTVLFSMINLGRYAICRHIPRNMKNGASPKLVVMIPYKSSSGGECFYMTDMPSAEDIRQFQFNPLKQSSQDDQKIVDQLMDKMNLMEAGQDGEQAVQVQYLFNPTKQYLYQSLFHRVSHPQQDQLPPLDPAIREYMTPQEKIYQNTSYLMGDLKARFGFKKNDIKKQKETKKIVWSELIKDKEKQIEEASTIADSQQQIFWKKFTFEADPINQINPQDPIDSFNSMISYQKKDLVGKAISEMSQFIQNIFKLNQPTNNRKIVQCLSTLRRGCIRQKQQSKWDQWLSDKSQSLGPSFKSILRDKGLGFISKSNENLFKIQDGILHHQILKVQYDDLD